MTRHGKPHCEAFPPLDILKAARSLRHADGTCEWIDERGEVIGEGRMERLNATSALFTYRFSGSANIARAAGVLRLDVSGSRRNPNVVRYSFTCPHCAEPRQKIFFVAGSWACRACHGLVYLKQRLANVNKTIAYRDMIIVKISEMKKQGKKTLAFHNLGRKLARIERELEAAGFTSMPQELLYRSYDRWSGVASQITVTATGSSDRKPVLDGQHGAPGLAFFMPKPHPPEPHVAGDLIGSPVLDRPFQPYLTARKKEQLKQVQQEAMANGIYRGEPTMWAGWLAERLVIHPLVITSEWSEITQFVSDDGQADSIITAAYEGDPTLWRIGPGTELSRRPLRAVLNDGIIMLRVRAPLVGRFDPLADLTAARDAVMARLMRIEAKFREFNADREDIAIRWIRHAWSRS
jgi:hypothetical protein